LNRAKSKPKVALHNLKGSSGFFPLDLYLGLKHFPRITRCKFHKKPRASKGVYLWVYLWVSSHISGLLKHKLTFSTYQKLPKFFCDKTTTAKKRRSFFKIFFFSTGKSFIGWSTVKGQFTRSNFSYNLQRNKRCVASCKIKLTCNTPFCNCNCCVASCKKSRTTLYFTQRCETSCLRVTSPRQLAKQFCQNGPIRAYLSLAGDFRHLVCYCTLCKLRKKFQTCDTPAET